MIVILSPAKSMARGPFCADVLKSTPRFMIKTRQVVDAVQSLSVAELQSLYGVSSNLAELNKKRFQSFLLSGRDILSAKYMFIS